MTSKIQSPKSRKGYDQDSRIFILMTLGEIIQSTFAIEYQSIIFPRELIFYIVSFFFQEWVIEEACNGKISENGRKAETTNDQGSE